MKNVKKIRKRRVTIEQPLVYNPVPIEYPKSAAAETLARDNAVGNGKKYKLIKGIKVPIGKYKAFMKALRKKKAESGAKISPALFKILIDKFIKSITKPNRRSNKKESISYTAPLASIISNLEGKKSDAAIIAADKYDKDLNDRTNHKNFTLPLLLEAPKNDKLVVYDDNNRKITVTKAQYDQFIREQESEKKRIEKEKDLALRDKEVSSGKLKSVYEKEADKVAKSEVVKSLKQGPLRERIKQFNANDDNKSSRIEVNLNSKASELLNAYDRATHRNLAKDIYKNIYEEELNKLQGDYKEEKDNKEGSTGFNTPRIHVDVEGNGKKKMAPTGLSNFQIDKLMKKYPEYLGCISHNEFESRILHKIKPHSVGCYVENTDPASKAGLHWVAVYFDGKNDKEIDYFNSFGDDPDKTMLRDFKKIADALDCNTYLKLKINKVKQQDNRSSNCGFFATKFLIDRLNGKSFARATGFEDGIKQASHKGEDEIKKFKSQVGYGIFSFIKSGFNKVNEVANEAVDRVKTAITGRQEAPPAVRSLLNKYGDKAISSIKVVRIPINSVIQGVLKIASEGDVETQRQKLGYDDLYHLALIISAGGHTFKLEKNESVSVSSGSIPSDAQVMDVPLNKNILLKDFIDKAANGNHNFFQYSVQNNCQVFVSTLLSKSGLMTSELNKFINQSAESVLINSPATKKFANAITDLGSRIHILLHGRGKKFKSHI